MATSSQRHSRKAPSQFDSGVKRLLRKVERGVQRMVQLPVRMLVSPRKWDAPIPVEELRSVLILRHDAIGDAVLTTPVWRALKQAAPGIKIGVAGSHQNREFLELDADIDRVYTIERKLSRAVVRELLRTRKEKYDLVLNLQFHDKSRGAVFSRLAAPAAVSATGVSRPKTKYQQIYSAAVVLTDTAQPITLQYLEVLHALVAMPEYESHPTLCLRAPLADSDGSSRYVVIHTDCSQTYKDWGVANYLELAALIRTAYPDYAICFTGGPSKGEAIRAALDRSRGHGVEFVRTPQLHDLLSILKDAVLVVSPDTSVVHFAGALGRPLVALYLEPSPFLPFAQTPSRVVFPDAGKRVADIRTEVVFEHVQALLSMQR